MPSNTIDILNSTLNVNKKLIDVAMQNIANVDNPKYSSKEVEVKSLVSGNTLGGIQIERIRNNCDIFLEQKLLNTNSMAASAEYISNISKEILDQLALPGRDQGIKTSLVAFENAIIETSFNPTDISLRNNLQYKANELTNYISSTAKFVQEKRLEADINLYRALNDVNSILNKLHSLNKEMMLKVDTDQYYNLSDDINFELEQLSKYFAINSSLDDKGILHVSIKNNGYEILGKQLYSFQYSPQNGIDNFINDNPLNQLFLISTSLDGSQENKALMINNYKSSELSYNFGSGLINGLLEVRDNYMPRIAETLDQLALNVAKVFNDVHNNGNGSSLINSITGIAEVSRSDTIIGNGNIIINPIDSYGRPITIGSYGKIPAMNLNLSQFTNNGLIGSFNVEGLVNEINSYFSAATTGNRLAINGFHTVNMAVTNADQNTGNNMTLDFDLISYSTQTNVNNIQFSVNNVTAIDINGNTIATELINSTGFNINNGLHQRTGINNGPSIKLNNTDNYPITISLDITTTVNNIDTTATITYSINTPTADELNSINGIVNKRFTPSSLVNSSDVNTQLLTSNYKHPIVKASIVDENGMEITDNNTKGFLKIENLIRNNGIVINQSDSILRSSTNSEIDGGFSSAFSMQDAFIFKNGKSIISTPEKMKNIAAFIQLHDVIKNSPNAFALGKMQEYRAGENSFDAPGIFYALGAGDTSLVKQYQDIKNDNIRFNNTKDLGIIQRDIYNYAADIFNINSIRTNQLIQDAKANNELRDMTKNYIMSFRGVDMDKEAIKIMQYQKNYSMATKGINILNNLFDSLINAIS